MKQAEGDARPEAAVQVPPSGRSGALRRAGAVLRALRVSQWSKNGLVALAALFSRQIFQPPTLLRVIVAFLAFSFAASAVYIFNDLRDRESDRLHPVKRARPIAAGLLSARAAAILGGVSLALALALTALLASGVLYLNATLRRDPFTAFGGAPLLFAASIVAYLVLNGGYTLRLKREALWDIYSIAFGFALRALAGAFAAGVYISPWFYLTAIFLSLVLAIGKRRAELARANGADNGAASGAGEASATRRALRDYTLPFLDQLMGVAVTSTLITYSLYTFQAGANGDSILMLTVPCVIVGVFRYLYLVYVRAQGEEPDRLLYTDPQILGAVLVCLLIILAALYGPGLHITRP
ncbi:MAG TPA: UbiA prenyltransferase family protein [Ktedonobacterales bacterium]